MDEIMQRLNKIEALICEQNRNAKEVLSFSEACSYLALSHSHLYKLTAGRLIPCYKPNGKKIYFKRDELNKWLLSNRQDTQADIQRRAADYISRKGRIRL